MTSEFGHWLAGFVAGEGCFLIDRNRTGYRTAFKVELRADDVAILEQIVLTTCIGYVESRAAYKTSAPACLWRASNKTDVRHLCALFTQYPLRARKANDFQLWEQAVLVEYSLMAPALKRALLADLKDDLEAGRRF